MGPYSPWKLKKDPKIVLYNFPTCHRYKNILENKNRYTEKYNN